MYKLEVDNLDDYEVEHLGQILNDYRVKLLEQKIEAVADKNNAREEWLDKHAKWHESVMRKVKWTKTDEV